MVAPYVTGGIVRSYVRITGSGRDRAAVAESLDLSNVSQLAASVPVPQTLPEALRKPQVDLSPAQANKPGANTVVVHDGVVKLSESNKRPNAIPPTESAPKRTRFNVVHSPAQQVVNQQRKTMFVQTSDGPAILVPVHGNQTQSPSQPQSGSSVGIISPGELIRERDNLRRENLHLRRRLHVFQQLFKDKNRLASVVKRLGVEVAP